LLCSVGNDIALVDIDDQSVEGQISLGDYPMAAYFPGPGSATCCSHNANWFSVVSVKGVLDYVLINHENGALKLEKSTTTELTSENSLSLSKLLVRKIIGGLVEQDKSVDREPLCSNMRQTFYIAFFGNSRSYLNVEPVEVEDAHAYSCEGDRSPSPFGYKTR
jgi:hypothetical protein